jgi:post-segregation antitoxin (ccd killing protein)
MIPSKKNYSSNKSENTRVKVKTRKKTVGITLPQKLVKRARKNNLNISRISEQALLSILDYLEPQNKQQSSNFLSTASFPKESVMVPRAGLEPATTRSSASPSTTVFVESSALPI